MAKTLGIIGGMGPEATVDLFHKIIELTPAEKDQDHIHIIIDSYPQIPDRTAKILYNGENPVPYLIRSAKLLQNAGVDAIMMPCNTAHYFLPQIQEVVQLPFISIIDAALDELKTTQPQAKRVMPIATVGTKAGKMYENALTAAGYTLIDVPDKFQINIMSAIYDGVKKGKTIEVLPMFRQTLDDISKTLKPDAMLAACTEIPILMSHVKSSVPMIDATLALARAAVTYALE